MSGGSLDYLYFRVDEAASRILHHIGGGPRWEAFAAHLNLVAIALHDCEWVMSCDYGEDGADEAIDRVVTPGEIGASALENITLLHARLGELLRQYGKDAAS